MKNHYKNGGGLFRHWLKYAFTTILFSSLSSLAMAGSSATFVHLFEWRWNDIATECEQHLGPKGYSAVQVSPPQEHIQGNAWWTRYQPVSLNIDRSRSGTRAEFISMVQRCSAAGVDIYVDAVINHMASGSGVGTNGSSYSAGIFYPGFSSNDFHNRCDINQNDYYNNAWAIRNCWLFGLADLRTGSEYVRQALANYLNDLINIGVKGFRIDASKHMPPADINAILSRLNGNPYIFQEVIDLGGEAIRASEYFSGGDVTEFKYSAELGNQFKAGQLNWLRNFGEPWGFMSSNLAVVFTDNHDNQRGHGPGGANVLTYKDGALYDLANVFMLAWPYGHPKVMSSYDFNNGDQGPPQVAVHHNGQLNCFGSAWKCEHRWRPIANMVAFRQATAGNSLVTHWWDNGYNQIAFGRGSAGFVVINREGQNLVRSFNTGLPSGEYCNVIDGDFIGGHCHGETILVDNQGRINISLSAMRALAIHKDARLGGGVNPGLTPVPPSSICYDNNRGYNNPHIYYWNPSPAGAVGAVNWPGLALEANGNFFCYYPSASLNALNIVFNDNGGAQTADLHYSGAGCYSGNQWRTLEQCGFELENPEPPEPPNTYICYDNGSHYSNPHLYYWNPVPTGVVASVSWPGVQMQSDSGFSCYDMGAQLEAINIVFNDNGWAQTQDLSTTNANTCYRQGQWTSLSACGVSFP